MTSSIPDSISTADLEAFKADAKSEVPSTPMQNADAKTQISRIVDGVEDLTDEWGTMFAYKLVADYCIHQMFLHHKEAASHYFQDGKDEISAAWSRDAGQFQVIGNTLRNIVCGPDDFLSPQED